jgi:putative acetyltransferase
MMRVRKARPEDAAAMGAGMKVVVDEGGFLATQPPVEAETLAARFARSIGDAGHVLLVLEEEGRLVGALGMHPADARGVLSLGMWILAPWRGRGGGRMLMEEALEVVAERDVHKLELEVFPGNGPAIALYLAMGFEIEGVRRSHYRRGSGLASTILMAKLLRGPEPEH